MIEILKYWNPITHKGFTYSCDMVRLVFEVRKDSIEYLVKYFGNPSRMDIDAYPPNFTSWKYRYLYVLNCGESTASIGLCFNGSSRDESLKGFMEFNPNKCLPNKQLEIDIDKVLLHCTSYDVSRFDLAIDMPLDREFVHMERDQRKYTLEQISYASRTEYLGQRNSKGRVKLYNKTVESKLDENVTRLEITFGDFKELSKQWSLYVPNVYNMDTQIDMCLDDCLNDTQKVLVEAIRLSPNPSMLLKRVGRKTAKKIEPYVFPNNARLEYNITCLYQIVANIKLLFNIS